MGRRSEPTAIAAIVVVLLLAYANSLGNGFHLDDHYRILDNPGIHSLRPWRHLTDPGTSSTLPEIAQYRPLLPMTLALSYALFGDQPVGYRVVSLLVLVVAALGVFRWMSELLHQPGKPRSVWLPAWIALAFALHPVTGILVNYLSARDQLLMIAGTVWAMAFATRAQDDGMTPGRTAGVLLCLGLALLSKTDAAVVPVLLVWLQLTVGRQRSWSAGTWLLAALAAALVAGFFAWTRFGLQFSDLQQVRDPGAGAWWSYPLTQARLHVLTYLPSLVWPFGLHLGAHAQRVTSVTDPVALLCAAAILGSVVLALFWWRRHPLPAFGIGAAWCLVAPSSSFLPLYAPRTDYRWSPALPCVFLLLGLLGQHIRWRPARAAAAGGTLLWFLATTVWMNTLWSNGERLWSHSVAHGGDALAHLNLAMAIPDRADPRVRHHLEEAIRQHPGYINAHLSLGQLLVDRGQVDEGLAVFVRTIAMAPELPRSYYWYARALAAAGRFQGAAQASRRAVLLAPGHLGYRYQALIDCQKIGEFAESLAHADAIVAREPGFRDTLFARGFAQQKLGQLPQAVASYQQFLQLEPRHAQARFNLAYACMELDRLDEAIANFRITLELRPDYTAARQHLEACLQRRK